MNYRSAMVLGTCTVLEGDDKDARARRDLRPPAARALGRHPAADAQGARGDARARAAARRGSREGRATGGPEDDPQRPRPPGVGGRRPDPRVVRRAAMPDDARRGVPRARLRWRRWTRDERPQDRRTAGCRCGGTRCPTTWSASRAPPLDRDRSTPTSRSSAPATPACGRRTTSRAPTRRCGSSCSRREIAGFGASGRNGGWCSALFPASLGHGRARSSSRARRRSTCSARCSTPSTRSAGSPRAEGIDCHFAQGRHDLARPHRGAARARHGGDRRRPRRGASARSDYPLLEADEAREARRRHRRARRDVHAALRGDPPGPARARAGAWPSSASASRSTRAPRSPPIEPGRRAHRARRRRARRASCAPPRARPRSCPATSATSPRSTRSMVATEPLPGRGLGRDRAAPRRDLQRPAPPDHLRPAHRRRPARLRRPRGAVPLRLAHQARSTTATRRVYAELRRVLARPVPRRRARTPSPTRGAGRSASPATGTPRSGSTRATGIGWAGGYVGDGVGRRATSPAARWPTWSRRARHAPHRAAVGRPPLAALGARAAALARRERRPARDGPADGVEERTGRSAKRAEILAPLIGGH